ncbi:hypothetical protein AMD27_13220 [Acinetobacter sp. TGL-Y2]|uniref:hypothetical protein n=1 Tax=Acinetobacter sp. TGL-Y2 TaxID=1407071 RepID=UPI0007A67200|nr:hypothetical protein [Acinetobacter sp. TGL-Y2]AMW79762.1 hypothetical protein AMD27_13220 [Acinetobacter sp. TGL-Y2]
MNIGLKLFWTNSPMPVDQKLDHPDIVLSVPFGNVLIMNSNNIEDTPADNKLYCRKNSKWFELPEVDYSNYYNKSEVDALVSGREINEGTIQTINATYVDQLLTYAPTEISKPYTGKQSAYLYVTAAINKEIILDLSLGLSSIRNMSFVISAASAAELIFFESPIYLSWNGLHISRSIESGSRYGESFNGFFGDLTNEELKDYKISFKVIKNGIVSKLINSSNDVVAEQKYFALSAHTGNILLCLSSEDTWGVYPNQNDDPLYGAIPSAIVKIQN